MSGPLLPFTCIAGSVQSITGDWLTSVGGVILNPATNASMLAAVIACDAVINRADPVTAAATIGVLVNPSSNVYFNGGLGDRLMNLPMGFVLTELTVEYTNWFATIENRDITLQQGSVLAPYVYAPALASNRGGATTCGHANNKRTRTSVDTEGGFNYLSALYDSYGFTIANFAVGSMGPNFVGLSGVYFQWSVTISWDTNIGGPGDVITLTDNNPLGGEFDEIVELVAYWQEDIAGVMTLMGPAPVTLLIHTNTVIQFIIPAAVPPNHVIVISALGNGTQFSGYAPLQVLNANLVDGSGIYSIYPDWRQDTFYDRGPLASPGDYTNLKIPKPYGKTGYFNAK